MNNHISKNIAGINIIHINGIERISLIVAEKIESKMN